MNEENSAKLTADFPRLYRNAVERKRSYSFSCGDGWFDLVYKLSADIEAEAKKLRLDQESDSWPLALQVKEKFGTLKFYCLTGDGTDEFKPESVGQMLSFRPMPGNQNIRALIMQAEQASATICDQCGQPGELQTEGGWWRIVCSECKVRQEAMDMAWEEAREAVDKEWQEEEEGD